MSATYYTYKDPYPATVNRPGPPNAGQIEHPSQWPRTYRVNSNYDGRQGIHPPGPIAGADHAGFPWGYYTSHQPYWYWPNGQYFPTPASTACKNPSYHITTLHDASLAEYYKNLVTAFPSLGMNPNNCSPRRYLGPGIPNVFPAPSCSATLISQAAMAAATNSALAAMPQAPTYYVGGSPAEVAAQQAVIMSQFGGQWAGWKPAPSHYYPYKPADGQQFWCKESDGSWTLRTHSDIINGEVSPGHWERHATSGYFYWVRT